MPLAALQAQRDHASGLHKVQVVEDASRVRTLRDGRPVEQGVAHTGLVRAYAHKAVAAQAQGRASFDAGTCSHAGGGSGRDAAPCRSKSYGGAEGRRGAAPQLEMWLVLEYCDKGCLQVCARSSVG